MPRQAEAARQRLYTWRDAPKPRVVERHVNASDAQTPGKIAPVYAPSIKSNGYKTSTASAIHPVSIGTRFRLASCQLYRSLTRKPDTGVSHGPGMNSVIAPPTSLLPRSSQTYRAIGYAGLLAGTLDITVAAVEFSLKGKGPLDLFQGIAGGLLGMSAFQGGLPTAALGVFFHYLIAATASAVFYLASRKLKVLVRRPISSGLLYGVMVYIFYVLHGAAGLRLSHRIALPRISGLIRDVAVHMFMVGLPISLIVRRYAD